MAINKRELAQLRRCVALLETIRHERATEAERDNDGSAAYHAGVALAGLEGLLEETARDARVREARAVRDSFLGT